MPMIQVAFTNTQNLNSNADQHERAPHIIVIINAPPHSDYDFLPPPTVHQTGPKNVIQHACSILQGRPKRVKTTTREKNTQTERSACIAYRPEAAGRVYKLMHLPNCKLPPQPAYIYCASYPHPRRPSHHVISCHSLWRKARGKPKGVFSRTHPR